MRKVLVSGVFIVALATLPSAAWAADIVLKAPAVPYSYNWIGFYVGLNAGYAAGLASPDRTLTAPACGGPICPALATLVSSSAQNMNPKGFTGGLQIGYNYQVGNMLIGLESDINAFRLNGSANFGPTLVAAGFPARITTQDSATTNWLLTVRPRVGFTADRFLAYVTGGLAVTDQNYSSTVAVTAGGTIGTFNLSASGKVGWAIGGGFEYAFDPRWSLKAEYLRLDFGTVTGTTAVSGGIGGMAGSSLAFSTRLKAHIVRAGINYRF